MCSPMCLLRSTVLAIAALVSTSRAITTNSYYFSYPAKTAPVDTVRFGDTMNVTWFSTYNVAVLALWCAAAKQPIQAWPGLAKDDSLSIPVLSNWTSPCHFQFSEAGDATKYFDSGNFDVTAEKGPQNTWGPSGASDGCSKAEPMVAAEGVPSKTATATATVTVTNTATTGESCQKASGGLSVGQSVGMGITLALGSAAATGLVSFLLYRRRLRCGVPETTTDSSVDTKGGEVKEVQEMPSIVPATELDTYAYRQ